MNITLAAKTRLPTPYGLFHLYGFVEEGGQEHLAMVMGDIAGDAPVLARVHSECLTGDALFSMRCDCGPQLEAAMHKIGEAGQGVIVYLRQEGRGIGLINKLRAYAEQDEGADTVEANEKLGFPADARDYSVAVAILAALGVKRVRLMTNNPRKLQALEACGVEISERVAHRVGASAENEKYLATKASRLGHLITD
ncbi:GTP cyclohydrolase II [Alkalilimnicola ehrlichii]|uniref:GTP cyclohydrolase-2 n=1 Tax=Alkalilimnicola ehrlichii TaxID=351052 RepID=A0A3E0WS50_9GAMM|nr:GTP cyclohydrolase II [Alkalilimnicola ehrlichii]RFA28209.1 GTP cyclohydrolase II [Alkalilimnicola ehrlichii]RFA34806.1 GTP cyclohydrolase II [Alkalilimnicola ehrlichii]